MSKKEQSLDELLASDSLESVTFTRKQLVAFRARAVAEGRAQAAAEKAGSLCAVFEGYVDGMPRIKWTGDALPAGTELFARLPAADAGGLADEIPITRSTFGTKEACEAEHARRAAVMADAQEDPVPPETEVQAAEAKLYRDLTGDAMALGYDGITAALEALRPAAMGAGNLSSLVSIADVLEVLSELGERFAPEVLARGDIAALATDALHALPRPTASGAGDLSDTTRLDWLVSEGANIEEIGGNRYRIHWSDPECWQQEFHPDPRAAIDAARRAANGAAGLDGEA